MSNSRSECACSVSMVSTIAEFSTVTLDSSSDSVCPGGTVVFTCTTDTGEMIWAVNSSKVLFNEITVLVD